jgi:hypothetical protein
MSPHGKMRAAVQRRGTRKGGEQLEGGAASNASLKERTFEEGNVSFPTWRYRRARASRAHPSNTAYFFTTSRDEFIFLCVL